MGDNVDVTSFDIKMTMVRFVNIICNTVINDEVDDEMEIINILPNLLSRDQEIFN